MTVGEEEDECDSESDCVSVADSQYSGDMYTLEDIDSFLDETFGQSVKVTDFFPDPDIFINLFRLISVGLCLCEAVQSG